MSKVPGTSALPDLKAVRLGVDNNRLSALVAALLDHAGGEVTLTKEEAERIWASPKIKYVRTPTGGLSLALEGVVAQKADEYPEGFDTDPTSPGYTGP